MYTQVFYCTIFSLLKHSMDSHFMAYNCVWWRLRSTYPISKKPFAFVESVFKNLSSERSNPTLPSLGINVVSSTVQICITSCQIWKRKWLSSAENTCQSCPRKLVIVFFFQVDCRKYVHLVCLLTTLFS